MRGLMMDFPLTVPALLERAGNIFGKVEIVTRRPDRSLARYTWGDLYRRARRLANALTGMGLAPRRPCGHAAVESIRTRGSLLWCSGQPGGVLHTLNPRLHPDEITFIANHAGDRFLIVDDVLLPVYEKFRDRVKFERVIVVPFGGGATPAGCDGYEELLAEASDDFEYPQLDENEAAAMCYTSGTTGRSKGVALFASSHGPAFVQLLRGRFVWHFDAGHGDAAVVHVSCERLGNSVHCRDGRGEAGVAGTVRGRRRHTRSDGTRARDRGVRRADDLVRRPRGARKESRTVEIFLAGASAGGRSRCFGSPDARVRSPRDYRACPCSA